MAVVKDILTLLTCLGIALVAGIAGGFLFFGLYCFYEWANRHPWD